MFWSLRAIGLGTCRTPIEPNYGASFANCQLSISFSNHPGHLCIALKIKDQWVLRLRDRQPLARRKFSTSVKSLLTRPAADLPLTRLLSPRAAPRAEPGVRTGSKRHFPADKLLVTNALLTVGDSLDPGRRETG
jgi:hypothetical protein